MPRPSIVLIVADDMGVGDLGHAGNPCADTPTIDRLAADGATLSQHYSGSCMCAPARAALLTGRYPHRTGAVDVPGVRGLDRIAVDEVTVADLLREAGYATGLVGKWHNGAISPEYHPCNRGFDEFVGFRCGLVTSYWDWTLEVHGERTRSDGRYLTDVFTDHALSFIDRHHEHPFFLALTYNSPHTPLEAPEEDLAAFEGAPLSEAVRTIYAMNRRMDAGVGRIMARLAEHGIEENTLVIVTSDNGPLFRGSGDGDTRRFNCDLSGAKQDVLEGGIRVPCVVHWPAGVRHVEQMFHVKHSGSGARMPGITHFCDWLPTLLDVAGVAPPPDLAVDGQSLLPALQGGEWEPRARHIWQWNRYEPVMRCNGALRDGPWKLYLPPIPEAMQKIPEDNQLTRELAQMPDAPEELWVDTPVERDLSEPDRPRLYNLAEDPAECNDLAEAYPQRTERMLGEYTRWFADLERDRQSHTPPTR